MADAEPLLALTGASLMNLEDMNKRIPEASQSLPSLDELTSMSTSQAHARLQRLEQHAVVEMDGASLLRCLSLHDELAAEEPDEQLRAAIDPQVPLESLVGELQEWCAGRRNDPPVALTGWCVESPSGGAPAYVTNRSAGGPRRILGLGLGLLAATPSAAGKSAGTRRDTALAVLLLAGREGLDDEAFFSATYGFALTSSSHRSALHVLTHRLRAQLPEGVRLVRIDDRNRLETSSGVSVPDPRCGRRTTDRVLRALAGRGASAKEVASSLGIGVRTAQKVLQELVDEGSCLTRKEGRRVTYIVEDTTFEEPTQRGPA